MEKEQMTIILLLVLLLISISKWQIYKISTMAILLYFAELGQELPDAQMIQKYRKKVIKRMLHIKENDF